ncbi:MAG TPA: SDR family oxidoreductase [Acidimicrobiales bacterium]|nr:SDR family oxidoreductase [Acidimicrobiales bacterium]
MTTTPVVVVERASSPLGAALVTQLRRRGAEVEPLTTWEDHGEVDVYVHVGPWSGPPAVRPLVESSDEDFAAAFERPVLELMWSLHAAWAHLRRPGARVIIVVPTIGMAGAPGLAAFAAAAEAQRLLVKSAARQWGAEGVAMNVVAPDLAALAPGAAGLPSVSLSAPALGDEAVGDLSSIAQLVCAIALDATAALTGATLSADGGTWMAP